MPNATQLEFSEIDKSFRPEWHTSKYKKHRLPSWIVGDIVLEPLNDGLGNFLDDMLKQKFYQETK